MQAKSFKGELYSILSDIDAEETFSLPFEFRGSSKFIYSNKN